MFNVMLVDDELVVRRGITTSIEWGEHGIAFVAQARNGREALDLLQEHAVDLILTDIRMPVMTGIELAHAVKAQYPDIEIVMLSGYEDFQYAKEAMSIGIRHYLLKPIMAEKLVELLTQLRDEQRRIRSDRQGEIIKNKIFNENLPAIKLALMNSLIHLKPDSGEVIDQARTLNIELVGPAYQVFVIEIDDYAMFTEGLSRKEQEAYSFAVMNIAEETLVSRIPGFVCYGESDKMIGLVNTREGLDIRDNCKEIQENIRKYLKLSISIGIGTQRADMMDLHASYKEAVTALRRKGINGKGAILMFSDAYSLPDGSQQGMSEEDPARNAKKLVKEAIQYIAEHYDKQIGLNDLARHVYVTPAHFSKVFKEEMGITFVKWLNQYRVAEAKKLLKTTWLKTYEIAEKVGFQDYKYFSMIFKKYTDYSPRDYRNHE
ncbi:response regulator [Paenibacillus abyssi]|uniref:DNA-binding response regulator n=1 Tax=Paenibacillus abyssi TaxID=1340531 RepID=A0A917CZN2_9BACL|nr:response regulator [Paenibacillus abyssi]GGG03574.1 hypothetical protein GCM10010916_20850 [Paenibacillus abyssi]